MKICWDNLEKLEYRPDRGDWQGIKHPSAFYIYKESCENCGESFLARKHYHSEFCDNSCVQTGENNPKYWLDKKHSEETKRKMSEAKKGEKHHYYGKHLSDEIKKKMSESTKEKWKDSEYIKKMIGKNHHMWGKKHSDKTKQKISENHANFSGEKHPNWKGGISCEPYCDVWLDKEFKESIMERDGYQCLNPVCSKENKDLCIHHINYIKKDCSPFNLITVCKSCNTKANFDREWHQSWYDTIIRMRYK